MQCHLRVGTLAFVGSPETVTAAIRKQHELIGYDILLTQHNITSMPDELVTASRHLFGEEVIPALRTATAAPV